MTLAAPGVTLGQAGRHAQVRRHSTHSCFPWHRLQKMPSHDTNFGLVSGVKTFFSFTVATPLGSILTRDMLMAN